MAVWDHKNISSSGCISLFLVPLVLLILVLGLYLLQFLPYLLLGFFIIIFIIYQFQKNNNDQDIVDQKFRQELIKDYIKLNYTFLLLTTEVSKIFFELKSKNGMLGDTRESLIRLVVNMDKWEELQREAMEIYVMRKINNGSLTYKQIEQNVKMKLENDN